MDWFRRLRFFLYIILALLCLVALLPTEPAFLWTEPTYEIYAMQDHWSVLNNEALTEDIPLTEVLPESVNRQDVVILSTALPKEEVPSACIEINTIRCSIDIFLGDEMIYSYGDPNGDTMIAKVLHAVPLPEGYGGQRISLLLRVNDNNAFSGIMPIYVGNRQDLFYRWIRENARPLFYGVFLVIYGVFLFVLSVFMFVSFSRDARIFFSSLMSILFGIYILAYHGLIAFLSGDAVFNTEAELVALYLVPSAIAGFLASIRRGRTKKIMAGATFLNLALVAGVFLLHYTNTVHLNRFIQPFQIFVIAEGVFVLFLLWLDMTEGRNRRFHERRIWPTPKVFIRRADMILFMGSLAVIVGGLADMISYNYQKVSSSEGTSGTTINLTMIGILVFVGCLLQNYFFYTVEHSNEILINKQLSGIAYTDPLTGLANRMRCEQVMKQLEENHADYSIISLDVNNLKNVNDTLGHGEGDRLLRGFAGILKECFREEDLIGRMGGDEFVVILRDTPKSVAATKAAQLVRAMEKWNQTEEAFKYSAACGFAHKSELLGVGAKEIYQLADDRMYEEKRRHHEAGGQYA